MINYGNLKHIRHKLITHILKIFNIYHMGLFYYGNNYYLFLCSISLE